VNTAACRPVAKKWLCKQRPLLGNRSLTRISGPPGKVFFTRSLPCNSRTSIEFY
jgi:hypothetical protein